MTIHEREAILGFGPLKFGRKPGKVCEPYNVTINVERNPLAQLFDSSVAAIMDVLPEEIYVTEYPFDRNGGDKMRSRHVVGPNINEDPLTREFFVWQK